MSDYTIIYFYKTQKGNKFSVSITANGTREAKEEFTSRFPDATIESITFLQKTTHEEEIDFA